MEDSIRAIENALKKSKIKSRSQAQLVLGQAHFELENFDEAKKQFRLAARDENKRLKRLLILGSSMLRMKQLEFKILISEESLLRNLTLNLKRA